MSEIEKRAIPCADCPRWMRDLDAEVAVTTSGAVLFEFDGGVFYTGISPDRNALATGHKSPGAVASDCPELAEALRTCEGSEVRNETKKWLFGLITSGQERLVCPATEQVFEDISVFEYFDERAGF